MRATVAPLSEAAALALAMWLDGVATRRDFTLAPPEVHEQTARAVLDACRRAVCVFSREFAEHAAIIADADTAIKRNAEQWRRAREQTARYQRLIDRASAALDQARAVASRTAAQAESLEREVIDARAACHDAVGKVANSDVQPLTGSIDVVERCAAEFWARAGGLRSFVDGIGRISRQAALLGTNALIEAAHLGETGKGFAIVAAEVRTLAESTKQSVGDVARIASSLGQTAQRVVSVAAEARAAVRRLEGDTSRVRTDVGRLDGLVDAVAEPVEAIAAVAAEQQAALPALAEGVERVAQLATQIAKAAESSAALDLEGMFASARALIASYRLCSGGSVAAISRNGAASELEAAIACVADGDVRAVQAIAAEPSGSYEIVASALARLAGSLAAAEREFLGAIMHIAVAAARNSFSWKAIASNLEQLKASLERSRQALGESRAAMEALSASAHTALRTADALCSQSDDSADALVSTASSLANVGGIVAQVGDVVAQMSHALGQAGAILGVVDDLSAETNLLAQRRDRSGPCGGRRARLLRHCRRDSQTRRSDA
jgi:methyl-accepting chemotaxis protein